MTPLSYHLFKTENGWMSIAWTEKGLARIQLPVRSRATAQKLASHGGAKRAKLLPDWAPVLFEDLNRALDGQKVRFRAPLANPLDSVYKQIQKIPRGQSASIEALALATGLKPRVVQKLVATNALPLLVPCHRVPLPKPDAIRQQILESEQRPKIPATLRSLEVALALKSLGAQDPRFKSLIEQVGDFRLKARKGGTPFQYLLRSIIFQQLNGRAAETIHNRVKALFGDQDPTPAELLEAKPELLNGAGLSRQKIAAAKDLARAASEGHVPDLKQMRRMTDEEIIRTLTPIRGVGRWTVEMLLIFVLGRTDVLALDDFAIRKSAMLLHKLKAMPTRQELATLGQLWKPYRSIASWYLWRALDQPTTES